MSPDIVTVIISAGSVVVGAISVVLFFLLTRRQISLIAQEVEGQSQSSLDELTLLNYQTYFQYQWSKRRTALEFSLTLNDQVRAAFDEINNHFGPLLFREDRLSRAEIMDAIEKDPALYPSILMFLSHYERLATAIAADVADDQAAFEFMGETVVHYVDQLYEFIGIRKMVHRHHRSYIYLEDLVGRWEKRLESRGYKPFDFEKPDLSPPQLGRHPHQHSTSLAMPLDLEGLGLSPPQAADRPQAGTSEVDLPLSKSMP
jgi:hypothetical protein